MNTWIALALHLFMTYLLGTFAARAAGSRQGPWPLVPVALLAGFYLETMLSAVMLFFGLALFSVVWVLAVGILGLLTVWALYMDKPRPRWARPRWYEIGLAAFMAEQFAFSAWLSERAPIIFDDGLRAWGGRGRALFGGWNFSLDPHSPVFMGFTGPREYPLAKPIYNALTALVAGNWTDALARTDSIVFTALLAGAVWSAVYVFSRSRALGCAAGFATACLPFTFWQGISGYGDVTVAALAAASVGSILGKDFLLAGLLAAGTAWAKNDGLFLFVPPLALCALAASGLVDDLVRLRLPEAGRAKAVAAFLLGLATLAPWAVFKGLSVTKEGAATLHGVVAGLSADWPLWLGGLVAAALAAGGLALVLAKAPGRARAWTGRIGLALGGVLCLFILWHFASYGGIYLERMDVRFRPQALPALVDMVLAGPTHSLFWIFVLASTALGLPWSVRTRQGRALLVLFLLWAALFVFVFSCTTAFDWLMNQTTVHRSALQGYGIAAITAFYGLWAAMEGLSGKGAKGSASPA